ncbi:uncharacterized protein LOC135081854 [Ostrinia nubilalis]|uniref:uncharacterized protein LOC135081854 n=1 Tax=Ostrinia nubilalis TaxID=29057 RepID=UPI0030823C5A
MTPRFYFALFVVGPALCVAQQIDPNTLINVFGTPSNYAASVNPHDPAASGVPLAQALPVKPINETLTDPDYWDIDELPAAAVADYDKFDWSLTKRLSASSDTNFLLSPLGLKLALAILTEAATGLTRSELQSVLGFEMDRVAVRRKFANIVNSLQYKSPQYVLDLGSKIYVENTAHPRQKFAAVAHESYKTDLTPIDFHNPPAAAKAINDWVANLTQGRITDLVHQDDLENVVVMILNTLYFKGSWRHQFAPNATKQGQFYVTPKIAKPVYFMNVKDKFYYAESAKFDAKILRMPYMGYKFAMYVVVPNSLTGLNRVLDGLTELRPEMDLLQERFVDVTLPRFQFEFSSHLDSVLRDMGVRQAFEDTASFPGIARGQSLQQRLRVSKVLQRSGIEVNELGSVAYSATEISLVNKFGEDDDTAVEVIANKPFFFLIQDETTRQLLFTGRVADPTLADGSFKHLFLAVSLQTIHVNGGLRSEASRLNYFDIDLLRYCAEERKGNVMVSPASIKSTLAMLLEGAHGTTESEIRAALRLAPNKQEYREQLNVYLQGLKANSSGVVLENANSVFISTKLKMKKEYEQMMQHVYLTEVYKMNFTNPDADSNFINKWVSTKTHGLINDIVEPVNVNPSTEVLLANALYFKGSWKHSFDPKLTKGACFYSHGVCKNVAMMDMRAQINYAYIEELRAHALELPYEGGRYAMIILVPLDRDGCPVLIRDLPYMSLDQVVSNMEPTDVTLMMPKFTIDYAENMVGPLQSMRVTSLFSSKANLSGIFEGGSPLLNSLYHKIHMMVDEKGTIAAATSAAMVIPLIENGVQLKVDRPFVFFIRDNNLGLSLFEGRIEEPTLYVEPIAAKAPVPVPVTPPPTTTHSPAKISYARI